MINYGLIAEIKSWTPYFYLGLSRIYQNFMEYFNLREFFK